MSRDQRTDKYQSTIKQEDPPQNDTAPLVKHV